MATPSMKSWRLPQFGLSHLRLEEVAVPRPGPSEVLVRVKAASLNFRDKLIVEGTMLPDLALPFVPVSDAAGEVVEVGREVKRLHPGDRAVTHFVTKWIDGAPSRDYAAYTTTLGGPLAGVLSEYVVLDESALIKAPGTLSDVEASTLPIAALTAWFALFETGKLAPGETIVVQGTGGVSMFALQFAAAAGARVIVTSSSDEKLARAKSLGASAGINYAKQPNWDEEVKELTGGRGADHVIEVVGGKNVRRSVNAIGNGGRISLIGLLEGASLSLEAIPIFLKRITMQGIAVGHRRAFEAMNAAIDAMQLKPVIDSTFAFADAPAAFKRLEQGPFGKVAVTF
ncbi:MAG TPA: NAD(P)-dependent alcohol dehydrogenase [Dongiaceae bacterium]|nr:NAD(P)-dependent alcohol dehydrogenase [Dongiaceae bacterium]